MYIHVGLYLAIVVRDRQRARKSRREETVWNTSITLLSNTKTIPTTCTSCGPKHKLDDNYYRPTQNSRPTPAHCVKYNLQVSCKYECLCVWVGELGVGREGALAKIGEFVF